MGKFTINITQRAFSAITECVLFVSNVSTEAAETLYKEIINSISNLQDFPNAHSDIEGLTIAGEKIKKLLIHNGRYYVLFKVQKETVTIYDLIDSRRDNSVLKL